MNRALSKSQIFAELTNVHEMTQTLHSTCDFLLQHFGEKEEANPREISSCHPKAAFVP